MLREVERGAAVPPGPGDGAGWLAGSLGALPLEEVLRAASSSPGGAALAIQAGAAPTAGRRTIWFRDGEVVFAASSDPSDHLGAVLWRRGLVALDVLDRLSPAVAPGRPLGQLLVDEGLLSPAALYDAIVAQVREIVLGAFHEREGAFLLREGEPAAGANAVRLRETTRELVAAAARRVAELERLAGDAPDPDAPLPAAGPPPAGLEARAARLLSVLDGARTPREAFRASALGYYEGTKVLASLARAGLVTGAPARADAVAPAEPDGTADEGLAVEPLDTYRRMLKRVFFRVAHATPRAQERLNSWFERLAEPDRRLFDGVRMDAEGDVDVARVLVNVFASGREEGPAARAHAVAALDAFLDFTIFEAKNLLPAGDAESLARDVRRLQRARRTT